MSEDDVRHGRWSGYQAGCREECCTTAARNYQKGRVVDQHRGNPRTVPALGTRRRIEALARLGWTGYDIARKCGHDREWLRQVYIRDRIHRRTAERIAAVYDELHMTSPPTPTAVRRRMVTRAIRRAERNGWPPPLAWDDIDDPDETPAGAYRSVGNRRNDEMTAEVSHLLGLGVSIHQAAKQLGVTVAAIEKAAERAKGKVA